MDRRKFLHGTANTLGVLGLNALQPEKAAAQPAPPPEKTASGKRRPNVLLIMSDQHRRTCMGAAGDHVAHTPNLDRLAAQSVRFTNAYCTNPICGPSRASMLTGLYAHNIYPTGSDKPYPPRRKTIAEHFSRADYLSALVGKMHFVDAQVHGFQYELEFNDWFQALGPRAGLYANQTYYPNTGSGLPQVASLWKATGDPWADSRKPDGRLGAVAVGNASKMVEPDHFESFVARESVRFLETFGKGEEPFFLVTSFLKPHDPFMPAERFANMFHEQDITLPPSWGKADLANLPKEVAEDIRTSSVTPELLHEQAARQRIASYYGNLAQMDDCVGQVLDALTRLDLDRDTIVLYTSDHGEMLGDLGLWNKFQFYEGSCGVPLMVRAPGTKPAVCETPVSLVSLAATLADLCSVPFAPSDGKSFAGLLSNPSAHDTYGPIFAEYDLGRKGEKFMVRDGHLKYTHWVHDRAELYDLKNDPMETQNLASRPEHQATVSRMKQQLFSWYRSPAIT